LVTRKIDHVDATSKSLFKLFSAAFSVWREFYHKSSTLQRENPLKYMGETDEEAIASLERKDS